MQNKDKTQEIESYFFALYFDFFGYKIFTDC